MNHPPIGLTVVIPVYNEAENILRTLSELDHHVPDSATVLVVHDFPEDNTVPVLDLFDGDNLILKPILNDYGRGAVNAIRFGLDKAETEAVLVIMGDLSDDLSILPEMLEHVHRGAGLVCASRYMKGGRQIGGPLFKKFLSTLAGVSLHHLVGFPTHDATNSFKLYTREVLDAIQLESTGGFEIGLEVVVKAWMLGYSVTEVPTVWRDRTSGESRFRLWAWLPYYLRWYFLALGFGLGLVGKGKAVVGQGRDR